MPPASGAGDPAWGATVPAPETATTAAAGEEPEDGTGSRKRSLWMVLLGVVIGAVLTLLVVAFGTSGVDATLDEAAVAERIEELEAQVAERDSRIEELAARLDEAEAAVGDRDADIAAQRDALDERAAVLDEVAADLDERQRRLDEREAVLAEREQQPPPTEAPPAEDPDDGPGIDLPQIDPGDLDTFMDRLLERIRDLFGGD